MNTFDLDSFFSKDKLQLTKVEQTKETIHIYLKSKTKDVSVPNADNLLRIITVLM